MKVVFRRIIVLLLLVIPSLMNVAYAQTSDWALTSSWTIGQSDGGIELLHVDASPSQTQTHPAFWGQGSGDDFMAMQVNHIETIQFLILISDPERIAFGVQGVDGIEDGIYYGTREGIDDLLGEGTYDFFTAPQFSNIFFQRWYEFVTWTQNYLPPSRPDPYPCECTDGGIRG